MPKISMEPPSSRLQFGIFTSIKYWLIRIYEGFKIVARFLGHTNHHIFLNITLFTTIQQQFSSFQWNLYSHMLTFLWALIPRFKNTIVKISRGFVGIGSTMQTKNKWPWFLSGPYRPTLWYSKIISPDIRTDTTYNISTFIFTIFLTFVCTIQKCGLFMVQSCTSYFTMGVIFLNPLCFLIVQPNNSQYFTVLFVLEPSINICTGMDFYMPIFFIIHSINIYLLAYEYIQFLFGLHMLLNCLVWVFPVIPILIKRLNFSWD